MEVHLGALRRVWWSTCSRQLDGTARRQSLEVGHYERACRGPFPESWLRPPTLQVAGGFGAGGSYGLSTVAGRRIPPKKIFDATQVAEVAISYLVDRALHLKRKEPQRP